MGFFNSGLFWFIEGILAVIAVLGLKAYLEDKGIPIPWWKWLTLAIWVMITGITIAFVGTSLGENEMVAATKGGIILFFNRRNTPNHPQYKSGRRKDLKTKGALSHSLEPNSSRS